MSQIFSEELFHQLPQKQDYNRKLVIFSDSREDSAQIANGVERNHYSELVREIVVDELQMQVEGEPALLNDIIIGKMPYSSKSKEYLSRNPGSDKDLMRLLELSVTELPDNFPTAARILLEIEIKSANKRLAEIKSKGTQKIVPVSALLPPNDNLADCGLLIKRLLKLGVNPAGNDVLLQEFGWDGTWHHWTTLFDLQNLNWQQGLPQTAQYARNRIFDSLIDSLRNFTL